MGASSAAFADADVIRQTTREVLQQRDYKLHSVENFERLLEWFREQLLHVFSALDLLYDFSPFLYYGTVVILALVAAGLIFHIAYSLRSAMQRRRTVDAYTRAGEAAEGLPETWERRASESYAAEDYLPAIRYLLHASLIRLEVARKAKFRRGATNREFLRRYRNTAAYVPLEELVEITDSRWFGGVSCSRSDVERCFQVHGQIVQLASGEDLVAYRS